jgi:hypothetical protein
MQINDDYHRHRTFFTERFSRRSRSVALQLPPCLLVRRTVLRLLGQSSAFV